VGSFFRRLVGALLLGVAVYGLFVAFTGYRRIEQALDSFHWWAFAAALGLSSFNYLLRFAKWEFYLARLGIRGVPKLDSFLCFLSGFVLTVTPGKLGEVFKSAVLYETHGVDPARTAPIVIAERLTDVIGIVLLISLGSLGFSGGWTWAALGSAAVMVGLGLIAWPAPAQGLFTYLERRGGKLAARVPALERAYASLRVVASPSALLLPTLLSVVGWGAEGVALFTLLQGFGQATSLPLSLFFYATATLAGALIPVPGGLGVVEAMFQSQLIELGGVAEGPATASMLMIRFATLWWAVLVGFMALGILRRRFPLLLRDKPGASSVEAS
jgi:uncharacterized membrane protein YbhN (UPF0104 family)